MVPEVGERLAGGMIRPHFFRQRRIPPRQLIRLPQTEISMVGREDRCDKHDEREQANTFHFSPFTFYFPLS